MQVPSNLRTACASQSGTFRVADLARVLLKASRKLEGPTEDFYKARLSVKAGSRLLRSKDASHSSQRCNPYAVSAQT